MHSVGKTLPHRHEKEKESPEHIEETSILCGSCSDSVNQNIFHLYDLRLRTLRADNVTAQKEDDRIEEKTESE